MGLRGTVPHPRHSWEAWSYAVHPQLVLLFIGPSWQTVCLEETAVPDTPHLRSAATALLQLTGVQGLDLCHSIRHERRSVFV